MAKDVTFTGAESTHVKSVILDGRRFFVGVEQKNVSDANVKRLKALDGHQFRITDPAPSGDDTK